MNKYLTIVVSQIFSIVAAYFFANWLGELSNESLFDIKASAFIALFYWPLIYLLLVTFISNLWFRKLNKLNYLIPAIILFLIFVYVDYASSDLWLVLGYWLIAFLGGWVLAWVVNFVVGKIKG